MVDPNLRSFVPVAEDSHFPIQNLPFGVFSREDEFTALVARWHRPLLRLALRLLLQIWAYSRAMWQGGERPVAVPLIEDAASVAAAEAESVMGEGAVSEADDSDREAG